MEEKDKFLGNVSFDQESHILKIELNPMMYQRNVVIKASYAFTGNFDLAVDGDVSKMTVIIRAKNGNITKKDYTDVAYAFYGELLHASVEETQARRYADTRNALIGAALKSIIPAGQIDEMMRTENNKNKEIQ